MLNRKAVVLVGSAAVLLATSKRARRYSGLSLRWVAEKGRSGVVRHLASRRPEGDSVAANAAAPAVDLPTAFADAQRRSLEDGRTMADHFMGQAMVVEVGRRNGKSSFQKEEAVVAVAAGMKVALVGSGGYEEIDPTDPEGWEAALTKVERGVDQAAGGTGWAEPVFSQPQFQAPAFGNVDDIEQRGMWAEVPGPLSPPMGMAPPVVALSSIGDIPDPWPIGAELPVAPAPWINFRRNRRFAATRRFIEQQMRSDRALGKLHRHWASDVDGRAVVHIANDAEGLHNELVRSGRIKMKGLPWQQRKRMTNGRIKAIFGRVVKALTGGPRGS